MGFAPLRSFLGRHGEARAQEPLGAHQAATTSPRHDRWLDAAPISNETRVPDVVITLGT